MTWYLLFEQNPQPCLELCVNEKYVGRTTDKEVARKHYQKCRLHAKSVCRRDWQSPSALKPNAALTGGEAVPVESTVKGSE